MPEPLAYDRSGFPALPDFGAHWMPVYWEPITGSGERITLLMAARTPDGEWHVQASAPLEAWECFLGAKAANVQRLINLVQRSLQAHFAAGKWLQSWSPPLSGLVAGEVKWALGRDWADIIRAGLADTAFFASLHDILPNAKESGTEREAEELRWSRLIREQVEQARPHWRTRFNRQVPGRAGARETRIDYLGQRYCANFSRLVPGGGMARHIKDSKAKLLDLELVRQRALDTDLFAGIEPRIELLTYVPAESDPAFSLRAIREARRAFAELEEFADKHTMRVESCATHEAAAGRIVMMDAA